MPLMAYSPLDQGRAAEDPVLGAIASERGLMAVQVAAPKLKSVLAFQLSSASSGLGAAGS